MILHLKMLEEITSYEFLSKEFFFYILYNYYYILRRIMLNEIDYFS